MRKMTIGSLFDGSGGFPLAGCMCGMEPLWASEIEPYPIAVTKARFPRMKHLGDVQKINGAEIDPVDVITFGSPCQDMSVAGKRAGLMHEGNGDVCTTRSGLFIEAIRIIREMRQATNGKYPAFAVWENVPGAFSSNGGADFKTVLEELASVAQGERVSVPFPEKRRWLNAGEIVGDGFSIAWRVLDAQYWGVPQRRKRIYLVADFAGGRAGKILFERESGCGNPEPGEEVRQGAARGAAEGFGETGTSEGGAIAPTRTSVPQDKPSVPATRLQARGQAICLNDQGGSRMDVTHETTCTLRAKANHPPIVSPTAEYLVRRLTPDECCRLQGFPDGWGDIPTLETISDADAKFWEDVRMTYAGAIGKAYRRFKGKDALVKWYNKLHSDGAEYKMWGNGIDRALTAGCNGAGWRQDASYTLNTIDRHAVVYNCRENEAEHDSSPCVDRGQNVVAIDCRNLNANIEISGTLQAKTNGGQSLNFQNPVVYDARGNGDGSTVQTLTGDHQNSVTDYTAICIGNGQLHNISMAEQMNTLDCMHDQQAIITNGKPPRRYIVRRLMPLECCRLQGFPDGWGNILRMETMTDADAKFWEDVRRTYAGVMGKKYRQFKDRDALVKWYNKLHTDSAEYKMWGNGIALPCALFVIQGIAECVSAME